MTTTVHVHWGGMTYTVTPSADTWAYKVLVSPRGVPHYVQIPFQSLDEEIQSLILDKIIENNDPRNHLN